MFKNLWNDFYACFIKANSYMLYLTGLRNTIFIAVGACLLGFLIGITVTAIRIAPKKHWAIKALDAIARLYITIIRGTPSVLQLFICYFVLLKAIKTSSMFGLPDTAGIPVAIICFGINSGAYMAEVLRGGINAVDKGQMEAGRSLGLNWMQTFIRIILPQSLRSAIPTMFNEFITLVKETSVAGYVGIIELTKIQSYITTQQMKLYMPLFIIAAIYLIIVLLLQFVQKKVEKRLNHAN